MKKKEQTLLAHSRLYTFGVLCTLSLVCLPVLVSVDAPDHSNGDANSCQYERAH